ncbi:MAG: hypothetical protein ACI4JB_06705 [Porcipelethomonas sp.]
MGRKKKNNDIYPHVSYICVGDNSPLRWDSLSDEQRAEYSKIMMDRVSENVSRYVNAHPEEAESLMN